MFDNEAFTLCPLRITGPVQEKYIEDTMHVNSGEKKLRTSCAGRKVYVRTLLLLLLTPEPCKPCRSKGVKESHIGLFRALGYSKWREGYLRGLWCRSHGLWVACAVVSCLLPVVLSPGGAVVRLPAGLGGGCRSGCWCCRLWGSLTLEEGIGRET